MKRPLRTARWPIIGASLATALVAPAAGSAALGQDDPDTDSDVLTGVVAQEAEFRADGEVRWIFPGPRRLDPTVFGTPDRPLGLEEGVGVPLEGRLKSDDGEAYTTTSDPVIFFDEWEETSGEAAVRVVDRTAVAGEETEDEIEATFTFEGPDGEHEYRVEVEEALPMLPDHEDFGGVGLGVTIHGRTGIGTKIVPQVLSQIAVWGVGALYIDDELVADNRLVHFMATERVRDPDEDYELVFDEGVIHGEVHGHLVLAPVAVTPDGPVNEPIATGVMLPNGDEQPFLHVLFEDVDMLAIEPAAD